MAFIRRIQSGVASYQASRERAKAEQYERMKQEIPRLREQQRYYAAKAAASKAKGQYNQQYGFFGGGQQRAQPARRQVGYDPWGSPFGFGYGPQPARKPPIRTKRKRIVIYQ